MTGRRFIAIVILTLALASALPKIVKAQDSDAIKQLLESADYWRQRGRYDKAAELWNKILLSEPNHAQALSNLAMYYAQSGDKAKAESYLDRLQSAHPNYPTIPSIRQVLTKGPMQTSDLERARALVREGRAREAVDAYRQAFGGAPPTVPLALEFYQTLGGLPGGWAEAREGLEKLAAANPEDSHVAFALAKTCTYADATRRQGIARLQALSSDAAVGAAARASWKKALLWLAASLADKPLYEAYLAAAGPDAEISDKMSKLTAIRGPASDTPDRLDEGYAALHDKDYAKADEAFRWALSQKGAGADALVGLALVQMQKQEFAKARALLEQAREAAPDKPEKWSRPLQSARFWEKVRNAEATAGAGDVELALHMLLEAEKDSPDEANFARVSRANILADNDRYDEATEIFRQVLSRDASNVPALQAMVNLMLRQGQTQAADVFNERLRQIDPKQAIDPKRFQSETLRTEARFQREVGDLAQARLLLEQAQSVDNDNMWVSFDLAVVQTEQGDYANARLLVNRLLTKYPDRPQFELASARLYAEQGNLRQALEMLNASRRSHSSPQMEKFRRELEVRIAADSAVRRAKNSGRLAIGLQNLADLQNKLNGDPDLLAIVALAYADLEDYDRSIIVMQGAILAAPAVTPTMQLQLASIYLKGVRYPEFIDLITLVRANTKLTARERHDLNALRIAYAVTRSDKASGERNFQAAYAHLAPLMNEFKDEPKLMNALGRLFYAKGEYDEAVAVFDRVLHAKPYDIEAVEGSIFSKVKSRKTAEAKAEIKAALEHYEHSSQMCLIAGRAYAMMGNDATAMMYLRQALALEDAARPDSGLYTGDEAHPKTVDSKSDYQEILAAASDAFAAGEGEGGELKVSRRAEIMAEMDLIEKRYRSGVFIDPTVRFRAGQPGLSQLTDLYSDVGVSIPTGYYGHFLLTVTPEYLDAGLLHSAQYSTAEQYGTIGATGKPLADDLRLTAGGVGLEVGYAYRGYKIFAGVSPLGFELFNPLGRFEVGDQFDFFSFRVDGHRSLVRDSLLSMAGVKDPVTGKVWGGVTRNGGRVDLSFQKRPVLFYMFGGYDYFLGTKVLDNSAWQSGAGLLWTVWELGDNSFVTGISASALGYANNQEFFTYGYGGYFSPQLFVNAGVPIRVQGKTGRFGYGLDSQIGMNWYREASGDYYPTDKKLQAEREQVLKEPNQTGDAVYPADDGTLSFALDAGGHVDFDITKDFTMSLLAHVYTAKEYTEFIGQFKLDVSF